ncbi:MAG: GGDEF domain-containing response regulator [Saccharospirillum sp.]
MPTETSILIVDDAKFSSAIIQRMLQKAGFGDVRVVNNAIDALNTLKKRPAQLLLADWLMPGMDGLELTRLVRELDRRQNTFTYVMLLTAKEDDKAMQEAFAKGVDDFVGKTHLKTQLLARIHAGQRLSNLHNRLLSREQQLKDQFRTITRMNRLDTTTGLGNSQYIELRLTRALQHMRSRNGFIGLILVRLDNLTPLEQQHGQGVKNELVRQACTRIQEHCRPLDETARLGDRVLGVLIQGTGHNVTSHKLLRRLDEALFTKAYATSAGYLSLEGCLQLELADVAQSMPDTAATMLEAALARLEALPQEQRYGQYFWHTPAKNP